MPNLVGVFTGGVLTIFVILLFRGVYTVSGFPLIHFPVIFGLFCFEVFIGFFTYKKFRSFLDRQNVFYLGFLSFSVYLPFFLLLLTTEKALLGLTFYHPLPGYAVYLVPALIIFPISISTGFMLSYFFTQKKFYVLSFFFGGLTLLGLDLLLFHTLPPLYLALFGSLIGFILLSLNSPETLPRYLFGFVGVLLIFTFFSPITKNIPSLFKSFIRNTSIEFINTRTTPYGELTLLKDSQEYFTLINQSKLSSYPDKKASRELVHSTLSHYPWAKRVLVIGGNHTIISEILKYPDVESIHWTSPVPGNFKFIYENKKLSQPPESHKALRVRHIENSEAGVFIKNIKNENIFDVVFLAVPDPTNLFFNRFYTREFFETLKTTMSDSSIVCLTLQTGEPNTDIYRKTLAHSSYQALKEVFPNTLKMYNQKVYILASHNRGFATSHQALTQFLNAIERIPESISPAFLRYKLSTQKKAEEALNINKNIQNTTSKPSSLRYSFTQFILFSGILGEFFITFTEFLDLIYVYFLTAILIFVLYITSKKEKKLSVINCSLIMTSFNAGFFLYILILISQIYSGKIFSQISMILMGLFSGITVSIFLLKNKKYSSPRKQLKNYSIITGGGLFIIFILLKTVFSEFGLTGSVFLSLTGGVLFGSNYYLIGNMYSILSQKPDYIYTIIFPLTGILLACLGTVFILPSVNIIWLIPALGIIHLGQFFILFTQ